MREGNAAYKFLLWVSEKGMSDITNFQSWVVDRMRMHLGQADADRLTYDLAVGEQWNELVDLELLKATVAIKELAVRDGGFSHEHGPALEGAANALYDHCGWEDEDITAWFGALVLDEDGENLGADVELSDDDEDPEG